MPVASASRAAPCTPSRPPGARVALAGRARGAGAHPAAANAPSLVPRRDGRRLPPESPTAVRRRCRRARRPFAWGSRVRSPRVRSRAPSCVERARSAAANGARRGPTLRGVESTLIRVRVTRIGVELTLIRVGSLRPRDGRKLWNFAMFYGLSQEGVSRKFPGRNYFQVDFLGLRI